MSQSLYRKYRSRGFDEIVGQSHITTLLKNAVEKGSFAHAYLFTGPRGTGKTSVARILAHAINGLPYSDDSLHLDIIEIDAASNRRIDDIRDLREKVHIAPSSAQYKIYIIDEVHMLTGESFNALLKTLEEPPQHVVFILATTELHKVPATIISRTQRFSFRPGSHTDISDHLQNIAKKEGIKIEKEALRMIASHSEGGFRDSVSLLDQVSSLSDSMITASDVESLLGLAPSAEISKIIDAILNLDVISAIGKIKSLLESGINAIRISEQLTRGLESVAIKRPEAYQLIDMLLDVQKSHAPEVKLFATISIWSNEQRTPRSTQENIATVIADRQPEDKKHPVAKTAGAEHNASTKVSRATASNESTLPQATDEQTHEPQAPIDEPARNRKQSTDFDWSAVLQDMNKQAPALFSVMKNATATYDNGTLTLEVGFALHRKKLQTDKYMKQLAKCIDARFNSQPEIRVVAPAEKTLDDVGSKVAEIMGGGEPV